MFCFTPESGNAQRKMRCPLWVKAEVKRLQFDVRFTPESGHVQRPTHVRYVPEADIIITSAFDTIADESERPHSSAGRLGPICGARTGFAIP